MRRSTFEVIGGFDGRYTRPSIEDIELGMRLAEAGGELLLDPRILCTHHKHWSLGSMVLTDICQRALPWSRLLRSRPHPPMGLNLTLAGRCSGALTLLLLACLLSLPWLRQAGWVALACMVVLLLLNQSFYRICLRVRGPVFMLGSIPLHFLYFLYSTISYGLVVMASWWKPSRVQRPHARRADPSTG